MPDLYVCGFTRVAYVLRHAEIRVQGYYARARACVCARARACVRLMTVNVCLCLRRRACVPVSDECAHVCALGKAHTHKTRKKHKKHGRLELQGNSNFQANADV